MSKFKEYITKMIAKTRGEHEVDDRVIERVKSKFEKGQFFPLHPKEEFSAALKERLIAKHRSQKNRSFGIHLNNFWIAGRKTLMAGGGVVAIILLGLLLVKYFPFTKEVRDLIIEPAYANDNFEVTATKMAGGAIQNSTEFIIKSKKPLTVEELSSHLTLFPNEKYDLKAESDHEFRLIPKGSLQAGTVYQLKIDAFLATDGVVVERDYSWAFQVEDTLRVIGTFPANKVTNVPVASGIEISFNTDAEVDLTAGFSISPGVAGKFEKHGRTIAFVPNGKLQPVTLYTVSLSKDVSVVGAKPMVEDYIFQFETESVSTTASEQNFGLMMPDYSLIEFSPNRTVSLPVWKSGNFGDQEIPVKVYAFPNFDSFAAVEKRLNEYPEWSRAARVAVRPELTKLKLASDMRLRTQTFGFAEYLVFPDTLPRGYYAIEIGSVGKEKMVFAIVTSLSAYVTVANNNTLLWVNSTETGAPVNGAEVGLVGSSLRATTNDVGVAILKTDEIFSNVKSNGGDDSQKIVHVKFGDEDLLIEINSGMSDVNYRKNPKYWMNTSLDRTRYQPEDTIRFWGFVAPRDHSERIKEVIVKFYNSSWWTSSNSSLATVTVPVDPRGYFVGEYQLRGVGNGEFELEFYVGNEIVGSEFVSVYPYTKPAISMGLTSRQKAIFAGENFNFNFAAKFFDGTPVVGFGATYSSEGANGKLVTNAQGEASGVVSTKYTPCNLKEDFCYQNYNTYLSVTPDEAESAYTDTYLSTRVFPAKVEADLEVIAKTPDRAVVSTTAYTINLEPLNNLTTDDDWSYRSGVAVNRKITGVIREISYRQVETGEYYDFIHKEKRKTYTYEEEVKGVGTIGGATSENGKFVFEFPIDRTKSYEVRLLIDDGLGHELYKSSYLYLGNLHYFNGQEDYTLRRKYQEQNQLGYEVGEQANFEWYKGEEKATVLPGVVLYYELQNGLREYKVNRESAYSLVFTEDRVPNVYLGAVLFHDGFYTVQPSYFNEIKFDSSSRRQKINISYDKKEYAPGTTSTMKIRITDVAGNPMPSVVHIKLVDEAYYALAGDYDQTPLDSIYGSLPSGEFFTYYTHRLNDIKFSSGAEGGACFLPGTKILMSGGSEKNIEDIASGDKILTFANDHSGQLVEGRVVSTDRHVVNKYLVINGFLRVTPEHRILVNGVWKTAHDIVLGDFLRKFDGGVMQVKQIGVMEEATPVYNFHVETYHTYIADGIYVHNDKGGNARSYFPDLALFKVIETNQSGEAELKFKLPDQITSWRITAESVAEVQGKIFGGMETKSLPATLPLFAKTSFPKLALAGDELRVAIWGYGSGVASGEQMNATLTSPIFPGGTQTLSHRVFERLIVPTNRLDVGDFLVTTTVKAKQYSDTIREKVTVVNSHLTKKISQVVSPDAGEVPIAKTGLTKIIVADVGRSRWYPELVSLSGLVGTRLDEYVSPVISDNLLKKYFNANISPEPVSLYEYQNFDGGFIILPGASPDLELSAQIAALPSEQLLYNDQLVKKYFYSYLTQTKSITREEAAVSLYGLAALSEPVLPAIKSLNNESNLSPRTRMYIALAAARLGDKEFARSIYNDLIKNYGKIRDGKFYLDFKVGDKSLSATSLGAVLGSMLNDEMGRNFAKTIFTENDGDSLLILPQLIFLTNELPQITATKARVKFEIENNQKEVAVENGRAEQFFILPNSVGKIKILSHEGQAEVIVEYEDKASTSQLPTDNRLQIDRKYFVNGVEATTMHEGDRVEIRFYPRFSDKLSAGIYEIVDVLPTGLKVSSESLAELQARGMHSENNCGRLYPSVIDDSQFVKFILSSDAICSNFKAPVPYYYYFARASHLGTFVREPVIIRSTANTAIGNFGGDTRKFTIIP